MGVNTVRLNEKDEKILSILSEELHLNKSEVIKKALHSFFEDLVDTKYIEQYEEKEKKGELTFHTAKEVLDEYK
ncbi:MAG: DUF6290 family protein [Spirochaetota bacterium]|nr:DUF6290 family protein [Spirochaetota bacterium]